ncbi:MAG TPA: branched-chain amino acid ABC transporter permease [Syntrophorhabdaceae bacterium]|nr:branched-chain amino acid ABC transporter permease [Syntrophorhabdaceae bacterium]
MDQGFSGRKRIIWGLIILAIFAILPFGLPRFYVYTISMIVLLGLLATSLNFALGYGGIYQFHHCVFYGAGAYGTALLLTKTGISPWIGFAVGPIVAAILSLIMGLICIRLSKLYFGMLQISLGSLFWAIIYRWRSFTGGEDGIHGIPLPDIIASGTGAYYFTIIVSGVCLFLIYRILKSPFGSALQGVRDNPVRSEMIGVNVRRHQLAALVISGFFAGIAGVLFVVVDNSVFPDMMFWALSMEVMIMCLLGGWLTFLGPLVGAGLIVVIRTVISGYTEYWSLFLGIILMLTIFFLPDGVLGYFIGKFTTRAKKQMVKG